MFTTARDAAMPDVAICLDASDVVELSQQRARSSTTGPGGYLYGVEYAKVGPLIPVSVAGAPTCAANRIADNYEQSSRIRSLRESG